MSGGTTLAQARAAKKKIAKILDGDPSVTGIGITRIGLSYGVKLNFLERTPSAEKVPHEIDGVPVKVETVGRISKRAARRSA